MALRYEILPYVDGNNLVAPYTIGPGTLKGSDNGPMFTSELYVMLQKLGQLVPQDNTDFQTRIGQCINKNLLNRVPTGQDDGQEGPDDYYGVLNGCKQMRNTVIPRQLLTGAIKDKGSLDNEAPGKWQWVSFLIRQPQLLACMIAASFPSWKNPLHIAIRILCYPLWVITAIIIAISCWGTDPSSTDPRRLSWHVWQCCAPVSGLVWLASRLWLNRLKGAYGPTGMQAVAAIYYQKGHPFAKYWITD